MNENIIGISNINYDEQNNTKNVGIDLKQVVNSLVGKLSDEDIKTGYNYIKRQLMNTELCQDLMDECENVCCNSSNTASEYRSLPCGNINSSIMYIKKAPSQFDSMGGSTFIDRDGMTISMIMHKLGIKRGDMYMTNFVKCTSKHISEKSCKQCTKAYLRKEITEIVKPNIIICDGIGILKLLYNTEVFKVPSFLDVPGQILLPDNFNYGTVYDVDIKSPLDENIFFQTKAIAAYNISSVLEKDGDEYRRCKIELWNQLLTAIGVSQLRRE